MTTKHTGEPVFAWYDPTTGLFTRNKDDPDSGIPAGSCLWPLYIGAPNADQSPPPAEPDYKQLFEQMCERCDALDAKLAEYSEREPVGYIMPTALKQLKAGGNAVVGGVSQGCDVPIYTAPQPTEPNRGEPVAWYTDDHLTDKSATTWDRTVAARWRGKGWPVGELFASPQPQQIPEGYKLVPIDPTQEMLFAGDTEFGKRKIPSISGICYKAMLEAAPEPANPGREVEK